MARRRGRGRGRGRRNRLVQGRGYQGAMSVRAAGRRPTIVATNRGSLTANSKAMVRAVVRSPILRHIKARTPVETGRLKDSLRYRNRGSGLVLQGVGHAAFVLSTEEDPITGRRKTMAEITQDAIRRYKLSIGRTYAGLIEDD